MIAVTTTPNNVAQYSGGRGGGSSLKFAVNVPNFVILRIVSGLPVWILKNFAIESKLDWAPMKFAIESYEYSIAV